MHALSLEEYFLKYVLSDMELDEADVNEDGDNFEEDIDETTQASEEVNEDYYTVSYLEYFTHKLLVF